MHRLHNVGLVLSDEDEEIGRRRIDVVLVENLVDIVNLGNIAVVVFTPNRFLEIVDVDPVVAKRSRAYD